MQIDIKSIPVNPMKRDLYLIIPAAGTGSRMGLDYSKQFLKIDGIPVLARTLLAFSDFSEKSTVPIHGVIVTSEENIPLVSELVSEYKISFVERIVKGGATRQDSVSCGIEALSSLSRIPDAKDIVFIHDGARCMVDRKTITACFTAGSMYDVSVAATPCKNTIKCAVEETPSSDVSPRLVDRTLDRSLLYEVQTPQVFKYGVLRDVNTKAKEKGITATDDTALAEALGIPVRLIPCSYGNIKITTPEDASLAEFLLKEQREI